MVKLRDAVPGLIVVGIAVGFVAMLALLGPTESKTSQGSSSASITIPTHVSERLCHEVFFFVVPEGAYVF